MTAKELRECPRLYKVTVSGGYNYKKTYIVFDRKKARVLAREIELELESEGYEWVHSHIEMAIINTPKKIEALDSYLATLGM